MILTQNFLTKDFRKCLFDKAMRVLLLVGFQHLCIVEIYY